jgi:hypothetical protein
MVSVGFGGRMRMIATAGVTVAVMLVAGCGESQYTYVSNTEDKAFFKVPSGWSEADVKPIDDYFAWSLFDVEPDSATRGQVDQIIWSAAYDADEEPTGHHMVTSYPTGAPVAYSLVLHMPEPLRGPVSLDYLRNIFLPVTESVRAAYDQAGDSGLSGFELLADEVLTPAEGIRGVRVVYNYRLSSGVVHTIDLTAHANNDSSIIYLLLIRCTAACYTERADELNEIATSFTVRSQS